MGMIYEMGYGVEKVPEEALRFYSRAAAQNHSWAKQLLASHTR